MANNNVMHFFSVDDAKNYGINAAIILQNIRHWVYENQARGHNFHDGKFWTFNSVSAFCNIFDYMTEKQIRGALDQLEEDGILVSGNYNKHGFDKTKWYTLSEKCLANPHYDSFALQGERSALQGERSALQGEPIPYINNNINNKEKDIVENSANLSTRPSSKKNKKGSLTINTLTDEQVSLLKETYDYFNKKSGQSLSFNLGHNQSLVKRIKEGKTFDMFKAIIDSKFTEWSGDAEMVKHFNPATLFRDKHFDLYYETAKIPIVVKSPHPETGAVVLDEATKAKIEQDTYEYYFQQQKCSNIVLTKNPIKSNKTGEVFEVIILNEDPDNAYLVPITGEKVIKILLDTLKRNEYDKKLTILRDQKLEDLFAEDTLTYYRSRFSEILKRKV